jgi:hypothetical protein
LEALDAERFDVGEPGGQIEGHSLRLMLSKTMRRDRHSLPLSSLGLRGDNELLPAPPTRKDGKSMHLKSASWEPLGLLLATDRERQCYQRSQGPLTAYAHLHIRFERCGELMYVEKPLADAETFPQNIYVKDQWGQVFLLTAV